MLPETEGGEPQPKITYEASTVTEATREDYEQFYNSQRQHVFEARSRKDQDPKGYVKALDASGLHMHGAQFIREVLSDNQEFSGLVHTAKSDGKIIGFEISLLDDNGNFSGGYIGVDLNSRGKGIGSHLIQMRHDDFRKKGIYEYELEMTPDAKKAFERSGCKVTELHKNEIGEPTYKISF